jgi:hypothetical protein
MVDGQAGAHRQQRASGASAPDCIDSHYGRRIENDRSWTVYHVFTGAPARVDGRAMTGLSRTEATESMLSLNRFNVQRRRERAVYLRARCACVGAT